MPCSLPSHFWFQSSTYISHDAIGTRQLCGATSLGRKTAACAVTTVPHTAMVDRTARAIPASNPAPKRLGVALGRTTRPVTTRFVDIHGSPSSHRLCVWRKPSHLTLKLLQLVNELDNVVSGSCLGTLRDQMTARDSRQETCGTPNVCQGLFAETLLRSVWAPAK